MSQPTVYGDAISTYVRSVRLTLEEKRVPHTLVAVDLVKGQHKGEEHLVRHPWGKMPAFEHDGNALYEASKAGVKIDLIVRGICSLRPGVAGLSENIHVRSIVGRFLEHSRIYYFLNDGSEEFYCSSADWMDRNMFRRNESCFEIRQKAMREQIRHDLDLFLADNCQAWVLHGDGRYERLAPGDNERISAQETFLEELAAAS